MLQYLDVFKDSTKAAQLNKKIHGGRAGVQTISSRR